MDSQAMMKHLSPHLHTMDKVIVTPMARNNGWWT